MRSPQSLCKLLNRLRCPPIHHPARGRWGPKRRSLISLQPVPRTFTLSLSLRVQKDALQMILGPQQLCNLRITKVRIKECAKIHPETIRQCDLLRRQFQRRGYDQALERGAWVNRRQVQPSSIIAKHHRLTAGGTESFKTPLRSKHVAAALELHVLVQQSRMRHCRER